MLCSSGLAVCVPITNMLEPALLQAQPTSANNVDVTAITRPRFSHDLADWVQSTLTSVTGVITSGTGTSKHWSIASQAVRAYARHLEATGIDQASAYMAAVVSKSNGDFSSHPAIKQVHSALRRQGSNTSLEDITRGMRFSQQTMHQSAESVKQQGYSYQFHKIADTLQAVSATLKARELARQGISLDHYLPANAVLGHSKVNLSPAVYHPGTQSAHLQRVSGHLCSIFKGLANALGLTDKQKEYICDALTDGGIVAGAATAALASQIVCDGAVILSIVATDGVAAVIAGPLESLVCDALSVGTGAAVTSLMAALTCALNC
jgi:hypothetical protein